MTRGTLLRIMVDEDDRWQGEPLYGAIVRKLRDAEFTGATVLKSIAGFGSRGVLHSARSFDISTNLPVLVEVFESEEKIDAFIPALRSMIGEGLITIESVQLVRAQRS